MANAVDSPQKNRRSYPEQAAEWAKGTPEDWANESHDVAVDVVYKDVPADGAPPKIDRAYIDRAAPVAEQKAGSAPESGWRKFRIEH